MEQCRRTGRGGIESHLDAIRQGVTEWLDYVDPVESIIAPSGEGEPPERPEAYDVLMQLRRFGLNWASGGYEDQPCILMMELNAVCEAEEDHAATKQINQKNRVKYGSSGRPQIAFPAE